MVATYYTHKLLNSMTLIFYGPPIMILDLKAYHFLFLFCLMALNPLPRNSPQQSSFYFWWFRHSFRMLWAWTQTSTYIGRNDCLHLLKKAKNLFCPIPPFAPILPDFMHPLEALERWPTWFLSNQLPDASLRTKQMTVFPQDSPFQPPHGSDVSFVMRPRPGLWSSGHRRGLYSLIWEVWGSLRPSC